MTAQILLGTPRRHLGAWPAGCGAQHVDPLPAVGQLELRARPNPITNATQVSYRVDDSQGVLVSLAVYNASGRKVRDLGSGHQAPGLHRTNWDGTDDLGSPLEGGTYFLQIAVGNKTGTHRTVLVR